MGFINTDLKDAAVIMAKVIHLLSDLEAEIRFKTDIYDNKEDYYVLAYMCRVGILDRIEKNNWPQSMPVFIPTGLVTFRKATISSGLMDTVGKLKSIVEGDVWVSECIEDILKKGNSFYEVDKMIPMEHKKNM